MNTNCRIGKVSLKKQDGSKGAELVILENPRVAESERIVGKLLNCTEALVNDLLADKMAGFAVMAWGFDGSIYRQVEVSDDSPHHSHVIATLASEVFRGKLAKAEARQVYEEIFEE